MSEAAKAPVTLRAVDNDPSMPSKPWQRLAVLLYVNGTPLNDVAVEVKQPYESVVLFVTGEKGAAIIRTLITENQERMVTMVEATIIDCLMKLVWLMNFGKNETVKIAAAKELLERHYPKMKANNGLTKNQNANFTDVSAEIKKLQGEIGSLDGSAGLDGLLG